MRPEFKEAMDSYEAFYEEYCDFMKAYNENSSDVKLIAKYAKMLKKAQDADEKFEEWEDWWFEWCRIKVLYRGARTRFTETLGSGR